jgi:hypothetical protein
LTIPQRNFTGVSAPGGFRLRRTIRLGGYMKMISTRTKRLKVTAAVIGGCAAVAMGLFGAVATGLSAGQQVPVVSAGSMTTGQTVTAVYSATIETSVAAPTLKAPPFGGSGS